MIASVDPGTRESGVALWDAVSGRLTHAFLIKAGGWIAMASAVKEAIPACDRLVIEIPQIYVRSRSKGDPNDLIKLAACAGAIVGRLPSGVEILCARPADWKGQTPKEVTRSRCLTALSPDEIRSVRLPSAKGLQHNVWDAVGLGLWYLRRLGLRTGSPRRATS